MKIKKILTVLGSVFLSVFAVIALVACSDSNAGEEAINRLSLLLDLEVEKAKDNGLASNLEVPYSIEVDHKEYEVTYTTNLGDNAKVVPNLEDEDNKVYIIEITQTGEEQKLTLTAEVAKKTKSWEFTIAKKDVSMLKTQAEINAMANLKTYAQWAEANSGTEVVIQGWITHACDYRTAGDACVWLQDENGGYYGYRVKCTQKDFNEYFKVGKKLALAGKVSPYGGWQELGAGGTYYVITDAEDKTFENEDITSIWKANKATDKAALATQNKKIKVTAKITSVPDYSSSQMSIGLSVDGNEYTAFCKSNYFTIPKNFIDDLKVGYTVEISGVGAVSSNKAQICPTSGDAIKVVSREVTPQDLVNGAVAEIKKQNISTTYYDSLDKAIELVTKTNDDCNVAYALSDVKGTGISLVDNKLSVTVSNTEVSSAKLTATITKEGAEKPATYEWKITTKTDKDVIADLKKAVANQSITTVFEPVSKDARQELLEVVSPSKKEAKVVYSVPENEYIKVGVKKSGTPYFEILKDVPAEEKAVKIVLTATITYNETLTETVTFTITVGVPAENPMLEKAEDVKVDQPLLIKFTQGNLKKDFYLTGLIENHYCATTEKIEEAKNFYLEAVDGGYHIWLLGADGKKQYMNVIKNGTYINAVFEEKASSVWTFNTTLKTFTTKLDNKDYFLGTKNDASYTTLGPVADASKAFYANFYVSNVFEADKPYVISLNHEKNNKVYYLNGKLSGFYADTTEKAADASQFFFEKTEEGYYVYIKGEGTAKSYLSLIKDGNYTNIKYLDKATTAWNYNVELNALTAVIGGAEFFMGTSNTGTYNTLNAVAVDKADKNFMAIALPAVAGDATEPDVPQEYSGVVTAVGFKDDTSKNQVRCFALVQNSVYPFTAKYVSMTVAVSETMTVEKIHQDWEAKFTKGKEVVLTNGEESAYNGLNQYVLESLDGVTVKGEGKNPSVSDITGLVTSGADLTSKQALLVKVSGICVVDGTEYYIQTAEDKKILIYFDRAFYEANAAELLEAGKEYTVSGFLNWFNNPQVTPIAEGAVVEILPQKTVEGTELVMADLGFENATPISWVKFTDGELRASAGTGSNAPTYYTSGTALRLYNGNVLTIKSNKKIVKIEFTFAESHPLTENLKVNDGTMDYTTGVWTGELNEFVLTNTASAQARLLSIKVTYAE